MATVVVFVIGFSQAFYTTSSSNPTSTFAAGDLRINLSKTGPILDGTNLKPGTTRSGTITVTNAEHKAKLTLSATGLSDTPPGPSLAKVIRVTVRETSPSAVTVYSGTLGDLDEAPLGTFAGGAQRAYEIEIRWPASETDLSLAGRQHVVRLRLGRGVGAMSTQVADPPRRLRTRIGHALSTVGLILVLTVAGLMVLPALLGYERYVIVSGSMEPTIGTGSVVYDKPVPVEDLKVGDIITFVPPPEFEHDKPVTHRIHEISTTAPGTEVDGEVVPAGTRQFRTKGDANEDVDPWKMVLDQPEQARVEHHIEYLGYIYGFLSNRWVQLLVIGLPALLLAVVIARALWHEAGDAVLRERAKAAAQ